MHDKVEHMLTCPAGRPPKKPAVLCHSFRYQAASWKIARRVAHVRAFPRAVSATLVTRRLEIEAPTQVLLTMLHAGLSIIR